VKHIATFDGDLEEASTGEAVTLVLADEIEAGRGTILAHPEAAPAVVESLTATFYGPSWAPAVAFGFLLLTLAIRPAGILGR